MVFNLSYDLLDVSPGSDPLASLALPPSPPSRSTSCFGGVFKGIAITSPRAAVPAMLHGTQQRRPLSAKERLEDHQGSSTLNHTMPFPTQKLKNQVRSLNCSQSKKNASLSSEMVSALTRVERAKQPEEPLRKVMYFSCLGPN
ncbi:hypothetical protein BT93_D0350 [Corymbia citriodora subsp. variegata]|nr:hypothetical protein BT93_D0350 [Corymbia citriodora subsp. variegata]